MAREKCLLIADELRKCSISLSNIADMLSQDDTVAATPTHQEQDNSPDPDPAVTLADVRSCLAEVSRAGFTDKVRKLIQLHGADKLSDIDQSEYAAVLAEAEELKNG